MRELISEKLKRTKQKTNKDTQTACFELKNKRKERKSSTGYSGDHSAVVLPESIPNSEVKCRNADGSVGLPHVRVGHRRIELKRNPELRDRLGVFVFFIGIVV